MIEKQIKWLFFFGLACFFVGFTFRYPDIDAAALDGLFLGLVGAGSAAVYAIKRGR